jgi:hypothetical protein
MIFLDLEEKSKHLIILEINISINNFKDVIYERLYRMETNFRL